MGTDHFRRAVLKGPKQFEQIFKAGNHFRGRGINVLVYDTGTSEDSKLAICISRKVGGAAIRNRLRRITREAVNDLVPDLRAGLHLALFPVLSFEHQNFSLRCDSIRSLFNKAHALKS